MPFKAVHSPLKDKNMPPTTWIFFWSNRAFWRDTLHQWLSEVSASIKVGSLEWDSTARTNESLRHYSDDEQDHTEWLSLPTIVSCRDVSEKKLRLWWRFIHQFNLTVQTSVNVVQRIDFYKKFVK